jgi:hypothetical protein
MTRKDLKASSTYDDEIIHATPTFSGARAFRRSHTITIGDESSSLAVTSLVAFEWMNGVETDTSNYTYVIRMPSNIAHSAPRSCGSRRCTCCSTASVGQSENFTFSTQVPDYRISCAAGTCKNVLDLLVPADRCDLFQFRTALPGRWAVWLTRVFEIPYVYLAICEIVNVF